MGMVGVRAPSRRLAVSPSLTPLTRITSIAAARNAHRIGPGSVWRCSLSPRYRVNSCRCGCLAVCGCAFGGGRRRHERRHKRIARLIEEEVSDVSALRAILRCAVAFRDGLLVDELDSLVVEEQPPVVRLDDRDVVAVVGAVADVDDNCKQVVHDFLLGILAAIIAPRGGRARARARHAQLVREDHTVRQLLVLSELLDVLEALQVERQHRRELLDTHALLRLLQRAARVAVVLVTVAQRLGAREGAQT
mmetsp:Transcript_12665/g.33049  ORF Transcript_12665/g.33049 Transcript_12665/m.33049 type:complete len:249 (+) Transcript_12665:216-962(+)